MVILVSISLNESYSYKWFRRGCCCERLFFDVNCKGRKVGTERREEWLLLKGLQPVDVAEEEGAGRVIYSQSILESSSKPATIRAT